MIKVVLSTLKYSSFATRQDVQKEDQCSVLEYIQQNWLSVSKCYSDWGWLAGVLELVLCMETSDQCLCLIVGHTVRELTPDMAWHGRHTQIRVFRSGEWNGLTLLQSSLVLWRTNLCRFCSTDSVVVCTDISGTVVSYILTGVYASVIFIPVSPLQSPSTNVWLAFMF